MKQKLLFLFIAILCSSLEVLAQNSSDPIDKEIKAMKEDPRPHIKEAGERTEKEIKKYNKSEIASKIKEAVVKQQRTEIEKASKGPQKDYGSTSSSRGNSSFSSQSKSSPQKSTGTTSSVSNTSNPKDCNDGTCEKKANDLKSFYSKKK